MRQTWIKYKHCTFITWAVTRKIIVADMFFYSISKKKKTTTVTILATHYTVTAAKSHKHYFTRITSFKKTKKKLRYTLIIKIKLSQV